MLHRFSCSTKCKRNRNGNDQHGSMRTEHQCAMDWCTEMEGTAVGQAAHLNKIPYLIIRAISDKADDSAQVDYPTFEKQAILHSVKLVEELLLML